MNVARVRVCEISRLGKFTEQKVDLRLLEPGRGGHAELLPHGDRVSAWADDQVLETASSDNCTRL